MSTPPIQIQPGDRVTHLEGYMVYYVVTLAANGQTAFCREDTPSKPQFDRHKCQFKVSDLRRTT